MPWLANNWSKAHSARVKAGIVWRRERGLPWGCKPLGIKTRNTMRRMAFLEGKGDREITKELGVVPFTVSKTLVKVRSGIIPLPSDIPRDVLGNR